ncbi:MAG: hypothetical protein ACOCV1_08415 [Bacillota bacterium]
MENLKLLIEKEVVKRGEVVETSEIFWFFSSVNAEKQNLNAEEELKKLKNMGFLLRKIDFKGFDYELLVNDKQLEENLKKFKINKASIRVRIISL